LEQLLTPSLWNLRISYFQYVLVALRIRISGTHSSSVSWNTLWSLFAPIRCCTLGNPIDLISSWTFPKILAVLYSDPTFLPVSSFSADFLSLILLINQSLVASILHWNSPTVEPFVFLYSWLTTSDLGELCTNRKSHGSTFLRLFNSTFLIILRSLGANLIVWTLCFLYCLEIVWKCYVLYYHIDPNPQIFLPNSCTCHWSEYLGSQPSELSHLVCFPWVEADN
jgi:hypothetical protein